jgi:hypothetical protein
MMCNLADGYLKYSPENNGRCRCSQLTGCIGNQPTFAQLSPKSVVCCSVYLPEIRSDNRRASTVL